MIFILIKNFFEQKKNFSEQFRFKLINENKFILNLKILILLIMVIIKIFNSRKNFSKKFDLKLNDNLKYINFKLIILELMLL